MQKSVGLLCLVLAACSVPRTPLEQRTQSLTELAAACGASACPTLEALLLDREQMIRAALKVLPDGLEQFKAGLLTEAQFSALPSWLQARVEQPGVWRGQALREFAVDTAGRERESRAFQTRHKMFTLYDPGQRLALNQMETVRGYRFPWFALLATDVETEVDDPEIASLTLAMNGLPDPVGEQRTLAILVIFNGSQPFNQGYVDSLMGDVSQFYQMISYGGTWMTTDIYGWLSISGNTSSCDYQAWFDSALTAAINAGANPDNYTRHVVFFPHVPACSWAGKGTLFGTPTRSWINSNSPSKKLVAHELGHNHGLHHAKSIDCVAEVLSDGNCFSYEYGNEADSMGVGKGVFGPYGLERLGWLGTPGFPQLETVTTNSTHTLIPLSSTAIGKKALKITLSTDPASGQSFYYYVSYRQPTGHDSALSSKPGLTNGVLLTIGNPDDFTTNYALDMTPESQSSEGQDFEDATLVPGQSYYDATAGVTITTMSANSSGATVEVLFDGQTTPTCVEGTPTLNAMPSSFTGGPQISGNYTVVVENNDSPECAARQLTLSYVVPPGWGLTGATSISVAPGGSQQVSVTVTPPASVQPGNYTIEASTGLGQSVSFEYIVQAPPVQPDAGTPPQPDAGVSDSSVPDNGSGSDAGVGSDAGAGSDATPTDDDMGAGVPITTPFGGTLSGGCNVGQTSTPWFLLLALAYLTRRRRTR